MCPASINVADKTRCDEDSVCYQGVSITFLNPLESRGNYSATSNNMKLVHLPLMGGLLHAGTAWRGLGGAAARPGLSSLYQMKTHPPTASVPITVLLLFGQLFCGLSAH